MIDFEKEVERFRPSLEIEEVEDAVMDMDLTDMTDILMKMVRENQKNDE